MLTALRLDADRLPALRADGDREALRILLGARSESTTTRTTQTNRLRALLLGGDNTDRDLARSSLTTPCWPPLARRRLPRNADRTQAIRHTEIPRVALALREAARALRANRTELQAVLDQLAPGQTTSTSSSSTMAVACEGPATGGQGTDWHP